MNILYLPRFNFLFVIIKMSCIPFGDVISPAELTIISSLASIFSHPMFDTLTVRLISNP